MEKTINFNYKGKDYTLEFNRESVKAIERAGFRIEDLANKPVTAIELLFYGAFKMHHPTVKMAKTVEIYKTLNHKKELVDKLVEIYGYVLDAMSGSEDEDSDAGNANWSAT